MSGTSSDHIPLVDLHAQYAAIAGDIDPAMRAVMARGDFVTGRAVREFEEAFAIFCQLPTVIGVGNGTDALELVLEALGVGPGDEVLVPTMTFAATAEAVVRCGARPVFVDCNPETLNLSPEGAAASITERTRAIIPVHLHGQPADLDACSRMARDRGLHLIEDAAQAHGARWGDRPVGSYGVATTFSFYPGKNLGAYGDAGAVATKDRALAERIRQLANHGRSGKYEHAIVGRNSRLDTLQAAVLRAKLSHLSDWNTRRRALAHRYHDRLRGILEPVREAPKAHSVYHIAAFLVEDRDAIRDRLRTVGIETGVHYPIPLHRQPAFAEFVDPHAALPNAERAAARLLSLPLYPELSEAQQDRVIHAVRDALGK